MSRTIFDKIWDAHRVTRTPGGLDLILIDRILLHERTGGVALRGLEERGLPVAAPDQAFAVMDHIIDTRPGRTDRTLMPTGTDFILATREAAGKAGIRLFDLDDPQQGIVHVMSPELGIVLPGATLICPDSHTCSQGALGALAWGIGSTEAEHALATSTLRVRRPPRMRIRIDGELAPGVTAKDLALALLGRFGVGGGAGHVVEYAGSAVRALDVEGRLTLCNMATEFAAFTAIIAPDEKVIDFLEGRRFAPTGADWAAAAGHWLSLASDDDARFDVERIFDARDVAPMITWGTSPQQVVAIDGAVPAPGAGQGTTEGQARALDYMGLAPGMRLAELPIDAAFIGSCTNSRIGDLRRAAALLRGRHVAPGVKAICVPGSTQVKRAAEAEGLDEIFRAAGFEWRESGCSMCFFAGGESFGPQERVVSSTNRNFESRQGPGTRTHLASPETVAASAIAGHIADPRRVAAR
ncbi:MULTISPECIES: 3-isopropylmalate dehydratase large subunit [unclassified Sphingomonas]|uniref:3-isopropylmalate dehydratase large subunit n=1 Tax=unclassified Sphingomonas TaxID=196159 RepID=UPI00092925F5|nr:MULTISPECIES: 3-isopropylmalate dehydratase large subunit [unclassified Sphingomonas]OJU23062.1 MAG: 3-isopropylmalate dehydratase [Sphingomonas sp. 66-10]